MDIEKLERISALLRSGASCADAAADLIDEAVGRIESLEQERNQLATAIRNAAVKRGIISEDVSLTGPHLLMLCNDLTA